jgi:hypothetical protein
MTTLLGQPEMLREIHHIEITDAPEKGMTDGT